MIDDFRSSSAGSDYELVNKPNESESSHAKKPRVLEAQKQEPQVEKLNVESSFWATYIKDGKFARDGRCTISMRAGSTIRDAAKFLLEKTNGTNKVEYETVLAVNSRTHEQVDLDDQVEEGGDYTVKFCPQMITVYCQVDDGELEKREVPSNDSVNKLIPNDLFSALMEEFGFYKSPKFYKYNVVCGYAVCNELSYVQDGAYYWLCTRGFQWSKDVKMPTFRHFGETADAAVKQAEADQSTELADESIKAKINEQNDLLPSIVIASILLVGACVLFGLSSFKSSQQTSELRELQSQLGKFRDQYVSLAQAGNQRWDKYLKLEIRYRKEQEENEDLSRQVQELQRRLTAFQKQSGGYRREVQRHQPDNKPTEENVNDQQDLSEWPEKRDHDKPAKKFEQP